MFVGILQFELRIEGALSIKDKRRVVKSVKDRLHRDHLVSVAEIGAINHLRTAVLGVAQVSASQAVINRTFDRILDKLRALHDAALGEISREILSGDQPPAGGADDEWTPEERRIASETGA